MERKGYYAALDGRRFREKPENWTHLDRDRLVRKDHPRIRFRGQLDLLQAEAVAAQTELAGQGAAPELVEELEDVLALLRQLVRSEALDEALPSMNILGLTPEELRAQSHDPRSYFGVEPMKPPHRSMGRAYAVLNRLRAQCRVAETAGVEAFASRPTSAQLQVLQAMNRLSSAFHILMCRAQAGRYGHG